jgi:hypothetical protein
LARVNETIAENGNGRDAEQRSMDCSNSTKDACSTEHDCGDGVKLVAGSSIRLRLP